MRKNRKLVKKMRERGWVAEITKNNHLRFTHVETGQSVIHGGTASDHRAEKNFLALVRRIEDGRVDLRRDQQEKAA